MPLRGKTPGLKRGRHDLPYWVARQVRRDVMNFPDKCIALPPDADIETLSRLCHEHSARLDDWIARQSTGDAPLLPRYDGSVYSGCQLYQLHPHPPFHQVKHNTRRSYTDSLKIIEGTVGKRSFAISLCWTCSIGIGNGAYQQRKAAPSALTARMMRCACSAPSCGFARRCASRVQAARGRTQVSEVRERGRAQRGNDRSPSGRLHQEGA
jgi:hypothetical protein